MPIALTDSTNHFNAFESDKNQDDSCTLPGVFPSALVRKNGPQGNGVKSDELFVTDHCMLLARRRSKKPPEQIGCFFEAV